MATTPKKPSKTADFRKALRATLTAYLNHHGSTVSSANAQQLEAALLSIKNDESIQAKMPTKEAFATQFDLAFKDELAHLRKVQLNAAHTEALNYLLQGCTTGNGVRNMLAQAAGCKFGLFQRSTGLPVELRSAHPSTAYPGEEWGHFQNVTEGATSCCQFRLLPLHYEFRPL